MITSESKNCEGHEKEGDICCFGLLAGAGNGKSNSFLEKSYELPDGHIISACSIECLLPKKKSERRSGKIVLVVDR